MPKYRGVPCGHCGEDARFRHSIKAFYCRACGYWRQPGGEWVEWTDAGSKYTPGHSLYEVKEGKYDGSERL